MPLIVASTIYFLVTLIVPDSHGRIELASVWRIWVFPYVHFWFLQAIIAIFAAILVLEHFGALATRTRYGAILLDGLRVQSDGSARLPNILQPQ